MRQQIIGKEIDDYMTKRNAPPKKKLLPKPRHGQHHKDILKSTHANGITIVAPEPNPFLVLYHKLMKFFSGSKK